MPMLNQRILLSSLALPDPRDFEGQRWLTREIGCDLVTPWVAVGGTTAAVWSPQGPSYVGPLSGLPAAADVRLGALATIVEAAAALTRSPSGGANMNRLELICKYLPDGLTKVWRPRFRQPLFQVAGCQGGEAQTFTAVAATGIIAEIGQMPAGLLSTLGAGTKLSWDFILGRKTTFTGTVTMALSMGPTPGTIGSSLGAVSGVAANANAVALMNGFMIVANATNEQTTVNVAPGGTGNVGSTGHLTNDLTVAQTLQAGFSSATTGDIFTLVCGGFYIE